MIKPVAVALCLLACGGSPDPAPAPLVVPAFPPRMQLAEAQATLSRPRNSLQVSGAGTSRMGAISLRASEGTIELDGDRAHARGADRKSTRLNSSHTVISYAVFCLKKKKNNKTINNYI